MTNLEAKKRYGTALLILAMIASLLWARHTLSTFLIATILAYFVASILGVASRYGIPARTALPVIYLGLSILMVVSLFVLAPIVLEGLQSILIQAQGLNANVDSVAATLHSTLAKQGVYLPMSLVEKKAAELVAGGLHWASELTTQGIPGLAANLISMLLAPVLSLFLLLAAPLLASFFRSILPSQALPVIEEIVGRSIVTIGSYVKGQAGICIIVSIMTSSSLYLLGINSALLLGIISGAASALPIVGILLGALPAVLVAAAQYHSATVLFKLLTIFAAIYFLEGYVVKPLVFRGTLELDPFLTILSVMFFGETLGFWGVLLAVPIASTLRITYSILYREAAAQSHSDSVAQGPPPD